MEAKTNEYRCPLLNGNYNPDSLDLINDTEARMYWLKMAEDVSRRFLNKVDYLLPDDKTAKDRAKAYHQQYLDLINSLRNEPTILGKSPLSVRTLLELNEKCILQNGFTDPWRLQKQLETYKAISLFNERINEIDLMPQRERWEELCTGLIAGNMFDWGAKEVANILDSKQFEFKQALNEIESRPWLVDDLDQWLEKLQLRIYNNVAIFVDNAGFDFILGVMPLTREFLKHGSQVILCANSSPALNDVTYSELGPNLSQLSKVCGIIKTSLETNSLKMFKTGQHGPCLNLNSLDKGLCEELERDVDLLILEGMGRALHTNLYAKFNVDSLKLAVVKNEWLAMRLGGKKFSVICKFESA